MAAPNCDTDNDERRRLAEAVERILELTDTPAEAAARRRLSVSNVHRMIRRGQMERIMLGRDVRVWRDQ